MLYTYNMIFIYKFLCYARNKYKIRIYIDIYVYDSVGMYKK